MAGFIKKHISKSSFLKLNLLVSSGRCSYGQGQRRDESWKIQDRVSCRVSEAKNKSWRNKYIYLLKPTAWSLDGAKAFPLDLTVSRKNPARSPHPLTPPETSLYMGVPALAQANFWHDKRWILSSESPTDQGPKCTADSLLLWKGIDNYLVHWDLEHWQSYSFRRLIQAFENNDKGEKNETRKI